MGIHKFAVKLRELRAEKFGTRENAAEKIGIPRSTIERWELGRAEPGSTALGILARAYGVRCDDLMELLLDDDPPTPPDYAEMDQKRKSLPRRKRKKSEK